MQAGHTVCSPLRPSSVGGVVYAVGAALSTRLCSRKSSVRTRQLSFLLLTGVGFLPVRDDYK